MKFHKISLVYVTLIIIISMPRFHVIEGVGFSIDLIHRGSIQSPSLYFSSKRVKPTLEQSFNHTKNIIQYYSSKSLSSEIVPYQGEYLMRFFVGTPQVEALAIASTGSDLTWIQCMPCKQCFEQYTPIFNPNHSTTYKYVPSTSKQCKALPRAISKNSRGSCSYKISYVDKFFTTGNIINETITLGSTARENVSIPNVIMGCGHENRHTSSSGASGIVGLGHGKESLIRQMGSLIKGKFSYCLVPFFSKNPEPSKMNFGDRAVVSGGGVVSTPIVAKTPSTFYFLTMEGMTVGKERFDLVSSSLSSQEGNIVIDSGTTLTSLPNPLYHHVEKAVERQTNWRPIDDPHRKLKSCYLSTENVEHFPEIIVHFKGADVKLRVFNTFVQISKRSLCLAFAPTTRHAIYGNLAQLNFLIGYDLEKMIVSFKPKDCSKA